MAQSHTEGSTTRVSRESSNTVTPRGPFGYSVKDEYDSKHNRSPTFGFNTSTRFRPKSKEEGPGPAEYKINIYTTL